MKIERTVNLDKELKNVKNVGIAGHIRPDGDAVGSCVGLYWYLRQNYPEVQVTVYLEKIPESYHMIAGTDEICHEHVDHVVKVMEEEGLIVEA